MHGATAAWSLVLIFSTAVIKLHILPWRSIFWWEPGPRVSGSDCFFKSCWAGHCLAPDCFHVDTLLCSSWDPWRGLHGSGVSVPLPQHPACDLQLPEPSSNPSSFSLIQGDCWSWSPACTVIWKPSPACKLDRSQGTSVYFLPLRSPCSVLRESRFYFWGLAF